jgi:eukaryotic-like serine/threonine-protein kinase
VNSESWPKVKEIFEGALALPASERAAFLDHVCEGDQALLEEVESLLRSSEDAESFMETPAVQSAAKSLVGDQTKLSVGQRINHYQIVSLLGEGGMGEVYLARDAKLGRNVAIKILPRYYATDAGRLRRFQQEARTASALNHPNILTIHEIGQEESLHFMATEYVEGETLREHLAAARMTLGQTLDVAVQVASALAAAHQAGIIHRDIKPENVMLRTDGYVKVLDFGLAKLTEPKTVETAAPTLPKVQTQPGLVMGTLSYMSPEQARGLAVDARTDIWSLGVMIYEMAAGRQPFEGETASDVMSLILQREPLPLAHFWPEVPIELERIVRKAQRKDKEERYQTVKDLLIDLRNLKRELELKAEIERSAPPTSGEAMTTGQAAAATTYPSSAEYIVNEVKQHKRAATLIIGVIIVSAVLWYVLSHRTPSTKGPSPKNATFTQLTDQPGPEYFPSLSPDGKSFAYASYAAGNWDIYLQRVGGKNPINLTKDSAADDTQPAFSPDGDRIAFRSEREGGGIFVMGATGESVRRLTNFGFNPAWSPDGKEIGCADEGIVQTQIRFNPNSRIWAVNVATGERRLVTKEDSVQPHWSPHGVRIAYQGRGNAAQRNILTIPAGGGEPLPVTNDAATNWNAVWSPDGMYLYFASDRGGSMNLWRVPIEEQSGKVLGPPEAVTTPSAYTGHLSFSHDGRRLAYANVVSRANLQQVGFDPNKETVTGQPVWITQGSRWANAPDLSPDGEWLAFDAHGGDQQEDLFVIRQDGTGLRQLTDDIYKDRKPTWSPDRKRIAFNSDRSGKWEIWTINSDGSGLHQLTYSSGTVNNPVWSPDGTRLAYHNFAGGSPSIIEVGKPWQEQSPQKLPPTSDSSEWTPSSWSPDGRRLVVGRALFRAGIGVYSLESQQFEKLTDFGGGPVWLSDSRRLLFVNQSKLYLIDSESKKIHEVLSVAPHDFGSGVALSRDNRLIYFSLHTTEADIWLMTLE